MEEIDLPGPARGGYDPAVGFDRLRTFAFPRPPAPAGAAPSPGTPLEEPLDRQIRRLLADELTGKGFRQASGAEPADMSVHFRRGATTRTWAPLPFLYAGYDWGTLGPLQPEAVSRGWLAVDIVEAGTGRLAWHARTTRGLGPGVTPGAATTRQLREAISELLLRFPPR